MTNQYRRNRTQRGQNSSQNQQSQRDDLRSEWANALRTAQPGSSSSQPRSYMPQSSSSRPPSYTPRSQLPQTQTTRQDVVSNEAAVQRQQEDDEIERLLQDAPAPRTSRAPTVHSRRPQSTQRTERPSSQARRVSIQSLLNDPSPAPARTRVTEPAKRERNASSSSPLRIRSSVAVGSSSQAASHHRSNQSPDRKKHRASTSQQPQASSDAHSNAAHARAALNAVYGLNTAPLNKPLSPHRAHLEDDRTGTLTSARIKSFGVQRRVTSAVTAKVKDPEFAPTSRDRRDLAANLIHYNLAVADSDDVLHTAHRARRRKATAGSNCDECSSLGFRQIAQAKNNPRVEIADLIPDANSRGKGQPDHVLNIVGRDPSTNPKDSKTWNDSAQILDIHQRRVYPARDFQREMDRIPDYSRNSSSVDIRTHHPANTPAQFRDDERYNPDSPILPDWMLGGKK